MTDKKVSISIVTYNNDDIIESTIDSLVEHTKKTDYHIYVIDNCSKDRTLEILKSRYKDYDNITIIENNKNVGFGRAHNIILDRIKSIYHIYINPDVKIESDVITDIVDYLDDKEDIGIITPKVLYPNGELQILPKKDPRLIYLLSRRLDIFILKRFRKAYEMADRGDKSSFDIEFSTGCFIFARTDIIKKINGFDEKFFLYLEDADMSRRVREFARVEYNPEFTVYHCWERGSKKSLKLLLIHLQSVYIYFRKWNKDSRRKA